MVHSFSVEHFLAKLERSHFLNQLGRQQIQVFPAVHELQSTNMLNVKMGKCNPEEIMVWEGESSTTRSDMMQSSCLMMMVFSQPPRIRGSSVGQTELLEKVVKLLLSEMPGFSRCLCFLRFQWWSAENPERIRQWGTTRSVERMTPAFSM